MGIDGKRAGIRAGLLIAYGAIFHSPGSAATPGHAISVSNTSLTFGTIAAGSSSAAQSVTIGDPGTAPLGITAIATSGDFVQSNNCGTSVARGAQCTVQVRFTPSTGGWRSGTLTITDNAPGSPHTIALSGTGTGGPLVSLSVANVSFPSQSVGTMSAAQTVTVANGGTAALAVSSISASGAFAQTNTCGTSIAAGASCAISVTFAPTAVGAAAGTLTMMDNALGSPHTVALSGTGTGNPQISLSAANLSFAGQTVGTVSTPQTVTVANGGTAPLAVSSISVSGAFGQTNTCGTSIAAGASCAISVTFAPTAIGAAAGTLTVMDNAPGSPHTVALTGNGLAAVTSSGSNISGYWANEGGDKVTQDELRATNHKENVTGRVLNRAWDGTKVSVFGARNEVVSFNLVLEAAYAPASNVAVQFDTLTGPGGAQIHSSPASGDGVFNWVGRPIELFYVRYLQITGLSNFGYQTFDERMIPARFRTPWTGNGQGTGNWTDRPDHDKFYPDILVPYELVNEFNIAQGQNQSIWADIYIPKGAQPGVYTGRVIVSENDTVTHTIPVSLTVSAFTLPDKSSAKTMIEIDTNEITRRYLIGYNAGSYLNSTDPREQTIGTITDKYYELLHRHKLAGIGENDCVNADAPCPVSTARINGSLFTAANGYDGPGVGVSNGIYGLGIYWGGRGNFWANSPDQTTFQMHADAWGKWFQQNAPADFVPFLYLFDEPTSTWVNSVETWAQWKAADTGAGQTLLSMSTYDFVDAQTQMADVQIPTSHAGYGFCPGDVKPCALTSITQSAADYYSSTPGKKLWMYSNNRPGTGSADTEDVGVAMRQVAWAQYKKGVDRWFYWQIEPNSAQDLFNNPVTWSYGSGLYFNQGLGMTDGGASSNGEGLLVYPGTDVVNAASSYGVNGPFASLRLKEWRRGIQDVDYLALAAAIDPASVQTLVNKTVPQVLWDFPNTDPSWWVAPAGWTQPWSDDPDDWESARAQLSNIVSNYCVNNPGAAPCN